MSGGWIKLSTSFTRHPKALAAGPTARHLYLCSLMWSGEYATDGALPAYVLGVLGIDAGIPSDETGDIADKLVEVGLWERTADGWRVHDWTEWQTTAEQRERKAELNRERQRKYVQRQESVTNASLTAPEVEVEVEKESGTSETRSRVPNALATPEQSGDKPPPRKKKQRTSCADDFGPDEQRLAWAAVNKPGVDIPAETTQFVLYHQAKGNVFIDWQKAWQGWMRNARAQGTYGRPVAAAGSYEQTNGKVIQIDAGLQAQARGRPRTQP